MLAAAETINRQSHGLVERPRFDFDRVLNSVRIFERHPALLHPSKISYSPFLLHRRSWLSDYFPRLRVLSQADKPGVPQVTVRRPFNELELSYQQGIQPPAIRHLLGGSNLHLSSRFLPLADWQTGTSPHSGS